MAALCLLFICGVLLQELSPGSAAGLFRSKTEANVVLQRQKRHNSGFFEEFMAGNIERECKEEKCDLEEAREAFENDEQTMEFWQSYIDGDQCKSSPCLNEGTCEDQMGAYTCTCNTGYVGSNCEIALERQCDVDNGGCMHFCKMLGSHGAECYCAIDYMLSADGMTCEPQVEWPCGYDRRVVRLSGEVRTLQANTTTAPSNSTLSPFNATAAPSNSTLSPFNGTTGALTITPADVLPTTNSREGRLMPSRSRLPAWAYQRPQPTTASRGTEPPVVNATDADTEKNTNKRIVGGHAVRPGEIPWQAALVLRSSGAVFCGGSIVGELWVVTAAHCLVDAMEGSFFVRVGEHNVHIKEGHEQDIEVAKRHVHPLYVPKESLYDHDVALLRLAKPIKFSIYAHPICLGPKDFTESLIHSGDEATVSGWGRVRFQGTTSSTLQKVELPYVDRTECKDSSRERITYFMFCAGYSKVAKDACQGDSGGPHAMRHRETWFLTGIVSWGEECAKEGKYGVYTRVSHYYRWMRYVMGLSRVMLLNMVDP